jgi:tetratricopeptide (TPR) repeat protein
MALRSSFAAPLPFPERSRTAKAAALKINGWRTCDRPLLIPVLDWRRKPVIPKAGRSTLRPCEIPSIKNQARRNNMNALFARKPLGAICIALTAILAFASISWAQGQGIGDQTQMGTMGGGITDQLTLGSISHEEERQQDDAYKAFLKEQNPAKKIQLGDGFLQKYPKSPLAERVDAGLMNVYRSQQDWKDTYRLADSALALQPDDVDVLTTVGWTIPHVYNPSDPDADQELNKAETYAKHAIDVLAKLPKPPDMNDAQFAASKAKRTIQAHSALGLVYFRRDDYENSAKELGQSTKDNPTPDPTDLFVLGADFQNLSRFSEAADAFGACSQIAGSLQNQCKQNADATKRQADVSKPK